jgi:hypothetical protein
MENVQIVSACTAYDDPNSGKVTILEFNQGLWFGIRLTNSLINPNQCQAHGIALCHDPYDPHCTLGFFDPVTDTEIQMDLLGSIIYFNMWAPTWKEIQDCPRVIMLSDSEWDPMNLELHPRSKEEEEYLRIISSVEISNVNVNDYPNEPTNIPMFSKTDIILLLVSSVLSDFFLGKRNLKTPVMD